MTADWDGFEVEASRASDARRPRQYEPSVEYQAGEMAQVAISLTQVPPDEEAWRAEIQRVTSLTVPEHRKVELAQIRYWGDPAAPNVYCRFLISDREDAAPAVDAVQILADLRKGKKYSEPGKLTGDSTLVVSWNDWQTAKLEGGGTAGLADRLDSAFNSVIHRALELRAIGRDIGSLVIIGGGDMVEGCVTFTNQSYEIDGDRRAQIRNTVTFILAGLDRIAPLFTDVRVLVVGGNHGENRINGKRTTRHDNDDCAVFEHAALAAARDSRLGHVKFFIAQDEPAKTIDVHNWILGTTHGHVFQRGAGGSAAKAHRWFSGQAAGRFPVGDSDVLLSHHYHHHALQDWGATLWVQTPTMDAGSPHFTDGTGLHSKPGMLSFVMTPTSRYQDAQIL